MWALAKCKSCPADISDQDWVFTAPYLILFSLDAGERRHDLREVFNALPHLVPTGGRWRMLPDDLPPWLCVHQKTQRWFKAACFYAVVHDFCMLLCLVGGRTLHLTAAALDRRTLRSTPASGARAGDDVVRCKKGSKVQLADDALSNLLALHVNPSNDRGCIRSGSWPWQSRGGSNRDVVMACVGQGYIGQSPVNAVREYGVSRAVVKLPETLASLLCLIFVWPEASPPG